MPIAYQVFQAWLQESGDGEWMSFNIPAPQTDHQASSKPDTQRFKTDEFSSTCDLHTRYMCKKGPPPFCTR